MQRPAMSEAMKVVSISPDVMSGTPVFAGTRVPIRDFIDALELAGEWLMAHAAAS